MPEYNFNRKCAYVNCALRASARALLPLVLLAAIGCEPSDGQASAPVNGKSRQAKTGGAVNRVNPAGQRRHDPKRGVHAKSGGSKPANAAQQKQAHMLDQIGKVSGNGWYLPWYKRDPAHPDGPPIPVLLADAETGEIRKRAGSPEIVLHRVNAKLFQKGAHAANIVAATVRADQQGDKVYATGGCRVVSMVNPADTVLTSDRLTWDIAKTRIIAEGHAHVERRPRGGGLPITQDGGTIIYDLERNTVTVE